MHDEFSGAPGADHDHLAADHDLPAAPTELDSSGLDPQHTPELSELEHGASVGGLAGTETTGAGVSGAASAGAASAGAASAGAASAGAASTGAASTVVPAPAQPSAADQLHQSISQFLSPPADASQPESVAAPAINPNEPTIQTPIPSDTPDLHGNPAGYVAPVINDGRWGMEPVGTDSQGNPIEQQGQLPGADVIGNPEGQARYWTYMGTVSGFCGPESVAMVLNEFGIQANEDQIASLAISSGDATASPSGSGPGELGYGMTAHQMADMLDRMGVPAMATTGTYSDLVQALGNGREVILSVDANQIWHNQAPGQTEGHAVVLTGIDPHTGMAYLNDPGSPDGRMEAVPLNELMAAWHNGGNGMVLTEHVSIVNTYGSGGGVSAITPGPIVLPITLQPAGPSTPARTGA